MWRSGFTSSCLFYLSLPWTGDENDLAQVFFCDFDLAQVFSDFDLAQVKCHIHVLSFLHPFLIVV
jgi:hypothetical protein